MRASDYLDSEVLKTELRSQVYTNRANTTAYVAGDRTFASPFDGNIYECILAGTSGGAPPVFNASIGGTTVDGTVTWLTLKFGMPKRPLYVALYTAAPGDAGGGTEVIGGSYARIPYHPSDANWSLPDINGNSFNLLSIAFPAPTANWGEVVAVALLDRATGGNLMYWGLLTQALTISNGDPAQNFDPGTVHLLGSQSKNPGLRTTIP